MKTTSKAKKPKDLRWTGAKSSASAFCMRYKGARSVCIEVIGKIPDNEYDSLFVWMADAIAWQREGKK